MTLRILIQNSTREPGLQAVDEAEHQLTDFSEEPDVDTVRYGQRDETGGDTDSRVEVGCPVRDKHVERGEFEADKGDTLDDKVPCRSALSAV